MPCKICIRDTFAFHPQHQFASHPPGEYQYHWLNPIDEICSIWRYHHDAADADTNADIEDVEDVTMMKMLLIPWVRRCSQRGSIPVSSLAPHWVTCGCLLTCSQFWSPYFLLKNFPKQSFFSSSLLDNGTLSPQYRQYRWSPSYGCDCDFHKIDNDPDQWYLPTSQ